MTAIEFLKTKDPNFSLLTDTNQSHSLMGWIKIMEEYAQHQVKNFDLADVGERTEVRVKHWNEDSDEIEYGTLINEVNGSYLVLPDDHIAIKLRWPKHECELIQ